MSEKEKIAILGAGPAGLASAFGLSATQELRDQYDITIYQVGWRAGGKCSSGREGATNRIEQNGTHYLFGCYDNCFDMVKKSYDELERDGIDWFNTYEDAFIPRDLLVFKQFFRGKWEIWPIDLPNNGVVPGTRDGALRAVDYVSMGLQFLIEAIAGRKVLSWLRPESPFQKPVPFWRRVLYSALRPFFWVFAYLVSALGWAAVMTTIGVLRLLGDKNFEGVVWFFRVWRRLNRMLLGRLSRRLLFASRLYMGVDFQCAAMTGLVRDRVFQDGFGAIEDIEFRAWLQKHGADEVTQYAPFVTTWYDAVAAYEDGEPDRPNLSAGVSVMAIAKAVLTYKGHFAYQMRAEIADSFIAPIFQCLRQRGVKIQFFQRVWDVIPGEGDEIEQILMERQVDLKSGDPDSYMPFITVEGRSAWPNAPLWDQIDHAEPTGPNNIESYYTTWRGTEYTLQKGRDFDTVVLALPIDTFTTYCSKLLEKSADWRSMVKNLPSVETQSIRLWFGPSLKELGWDLDAPVLSAYTKPFSTWEDNGRLVDVETWPPYPGGPVPNAMATVFGALPAPHVSPSYEDTDYPCDQQAKADAHAMKFMEWDIGPLWPGAASPADPLGVDWSKLIDPEGRSGRERMKAQYVRANSGPLERYTMARADTSQYRLAADESGYRNMFLAGAWIQNLFLIGSVEGAIMGGLQASRAISGYPATITGEVPGL